VNAETPLGFVALFLVGAVASGINAVAGGGSLISFPCLTLGFGLPSLIANATNSVGLWPGSLSGAWGFRNVLGPTQKYLRLLVAPTLIGSAAGAYLLTITDKRVFEAAVPVLLLIATVLLYLQPQVKAWVLGDRAHIGPAWAILLQTLVAIYGGYFGAGMGIMMLAVFGLFMHANTHEINAVKTILGVGINLTASILFFSKGMVVFVPALALTLGSIVGGYAAAKGSQKVDPDRLRVAIALFGFGMAAHFAWLLWG
jgi:hypothetical protein